MPVSRQRRLVAFAAISALVIAMAVAEAAFAQSSPFGTTASRAAESGGGGLAGWILAKQAEFYRALSAAIRAVKADGSAAWGLLALSFLYGVFHAAGPGHGKAVISSYIVANGETWRRGLALSLLSALLQGATAVAIVSVAAFALQASRRGICDSEYWTELASYGMIAALGAVLLWRKGRGLWRMLKVAAVRIPAIATSVGAQAARDRLDHRHHHDHHGDAHQHHADHDHAGCGHAHGPQPQELGGTGGWRRGLVATVAVGARPCSGAILVLVFSLSQGLFWAGIASVFAMAFGTALTVAAVATLAVFARGVAARLAGHGLAGSRAVLALRLVELAAAALVLLLGLALLAGYAASERLMMAC